MQYSIWQGVLPTCQLRLQDLAKESDILPHLEQAANELDEEFHILLPF